MIVQIKKGFYNDYKDSASVFLNSPNLKFKLFSKF